MRSKSNVKKKLYIFMLTNFIMLFVKRRHSFLSVFPMLPIINFIFLSHYYVHRQQNLTTTAKSVKRFKQNYRDRKIDFFYSRQNLKKIIKKYTVFKSL